MYLGMFMRVLPERLNRERKTHQNGTILREKVLD